MKFKELMMTSLTSLLVADETLQHPIYGVVNMNNAQNYGFFGFTETHLLMALVSGSHITYRTRIPLDIRSVKIKTTAILKQRVIDICFNDGMRLNITAAKSVWTIDSQKQDLPLFLERLESLAPREQQPSLKSIRGKRIRWQYFNVAVFAYLAIIPSIILMVLILDMKAGKADFLTGLAELLSTIPVFIVFLAPLVVLSLLNRFVFGKTVGVISDGQLFLDNYSIPLEDIEKIVYSPRIGSKYKIEYTFATLHVAPYKGKAREICVLHFPMYGLKMLKKHKPGLRVKLDKEGLFWILLGALGPTVLGALVALLI